MKNKNLFLLLGFLTIIFIIGCVQTPSISPSQPATSGPLIRETGGSEVRSGVDCSWTCHCASKLKDCDADESQWDICLDTKQSDPKKVENCEECKRVADSSCAKRTCPADPAQGPKYVFQYFCNGRAQQFSSVPQRLGDAIIATPSVGTSIGDNVKRLPEQEYAISNEGRMTCTFGCACQVDTGMCDDQEQRSRLCSDKEDITISAINCGICQAKARAVCSQKPCPIATRTTKVATGLKCSE